MMANQHSLLTQEWPSHIYILIGILDACASVSLSNEVLLSNEYGKDESVHQVREAMKLGIPQASIEILSISLSTQGEKLCSLAAKQAGGERLVAVNLCDGTETDGYPFYVTVPMCGLLHLQGIGVVRALEANKIPFTGADSVFYEITTSKPVLKRELIACGVETSPFVEIRNGMEDADLQHANDAIGWPMIIKPSISYASMNITEKSIVHSHKEALHQILALRQATTDAMFVEAFLPGREFTVLCIGDAKLGVKTFTVAERAFNSSLKSEQRILAFDRYWEGYGIDGSQPDKPSELYEYRAAPDAWQEKLAGLATRAFLACKGSGYGRVDIRTRSMDKPDALVLEVNANCGMSFKPGSSSLAEILQLSSTSPELFCQQLLPKHSSKHMSGTVKLSRDVEAQVEALATKLNRRSIHGAMPVSMETAKLLRTVVSGSRWTDSQTLVAIVNQVAARLKRAQPIELSSGSIAQRVIHLIREEEGVLKAEDLAVVNVALLNLPQRSCAAFALTCLLLLTNQPIQMKSIVRQGITEMIDELETANTNIAVQALEHIHSNEIIMTIGGSSVVEQFLKEAAKLRTFQVIVAETAPFYSGHELAASLSTAGIDTTLITDSAIFAIMSRVNKVILGAHAVTANGGLIAISGSNAVAISAKFHSTPVVVCAGLHTLSPDYPYDTDSFNLCVSPNSMSNFEDAEFTKDVELPNPHYDYISPDYLSLFITNIGAHPSSKRVMEPAGTDFDEQTLDELANTVFKVVREGQANQLAKICSNKNQQAVQILLTHTDSHGSTALLIAALTQSDVYAVPVSAAHLELGANANDSNAYGWTPLMLAALNGDTAHVRMLLDHGAQVDTLSKFGLTALCCAAQKRNLQVVQMILDSGANVNLTGGSAGLTPLMLAANSGSHDL
eukprot:jgi/Hompol1/4640/HPOL_001820-RA